MLSLFKQVAHGDAPFVEGNERIECVEEESLPTAAEIMPVIDWPAVFQSIKEYKQYQADSK